MLKDVAKIDMQHIPFRGATQALPMLATGDVDLFFDMIATGMPQVEAGRAKVSPSPARRACPATRHPDPGRARLRATR